MLPLPGAFAGEAPFDPGVSEARLQGGGALRLAEAQRIDGVIRFQRQRAPGTGGGSAMEKVIGQSHAQRKVGGASEGRDGSQPDGS